MFKKVMPEEAGIPSGQIKKYIEFLENKGLTMHDVIIARGNNIIFEKYWEPFNRDYLHRMYSVTKSFVSLAIGFLEQDGLISLEDKIIKYFPQETKTLTDKNFREQTIRNMLMMSTSKIENSWFVAKPDDRVAYYFSNYQKNTRPAGRIFCYDSSGSFVLGALVERVTGKKFLDYLREKFLDEIGFSKEAYCLKCPGGHSWADSGLLCTARDLLKVARFVMDGGKANGKQLLNKEYIRQATDKQIDNNSMNINQHNTQGYGYQIWRTYQNSYMFYGMGCQYALSIPDKDLIMVCNANNQGKAFAEEAVIGGFFDYVADYVGETRKEDIQAFADLTEYTDSLKLKTAAGKKESPACQEKVNGVLYDLAENPMGIKNFRLNFNEKGGEFTYTNGQGYKCIKFGMCENAFGKFPQEGYSDEVGATYEEGNFYDCAASAAWVEENKLFIKVQIIDKYLGWLNIIISFSGDVAAVFMNKSAEAFLNEYEGYASARKNKKGAIN